MEILTLAEPSPGTRSGERGVSLIETLVALLILSFVAVSTLAMFSQGMRLNASGADYTAITNIAKDKSEQLLNLDYDDPELAPDVTMSETRNQPQVLVTWRVAEHHFVQGSLDPDTVFADAPMVSTAAGTGNVKVISVTANSQGMYALGQRTVTVQAILVNQIPATPTPAPTPTPSP